MLDELLKERKERKKIYKKKICGYLCVGASLTPNRSLISLKVVPARALVKMSAVCWLVGMYPILISFFSCCSRTKWYFTSMCSVFLCSSGFPANLIALWLLQYRDVGLDCWQLIPFISRRNQTTSLDASLRETYSASVVDWVIHVCRMLSHEAGHLFAMNTSPDVDRLVSVSP